MRLALAQLNPLVGDLEGNGERILAVCEEAAAGGATLVLTPELSMWGYPPRDLLLHQALVDLQQSVLHRLAATVPEGLTVLVGVAEPVEGGGHPRLYNALALVERGHWRFVGRKRLLPSYDVFDERRYFRAGQRPSVLELNHGGRRWRLGLTICEDLWVEEEVLGHRLAGADPIAELQQEGIDLLLNLSASPFGRGKDQLRHALAARAASRLGCPVVYLNQVGGNDELIFDGSSFVMDHKGQLSLQLACAVEQVRFWDSHGPSEAESLAPSAPAPSTLESLLRVLVLGVADYSRKCGFSEALLGLSGGIDSALVAVIATAALGCERVQALLMPSPYSSEGSVSDGRSLAGRLGITTHTLPIAPLMEGFDDALACVLGGAPQGVTAENLQSRIRGSLLMAVANQRGSLLLSTGNKSELAVGYCTLYGDMNGGLAVIGDLYKSTVFSLCDWIDSPASVPWRNSMGLLSTDDLIGRAIRTKPPSAELRPDQRDSDSLPDYGVLDALLKASIEEGVPPEQLILQGGDPAVVAHVQQLMRRAEFKRRQAPPVLKVSSRAFGSGWRMPIAAL